MRAIRSGTRVESVISKAVVADPPGHGVFGFGDHGRARRDNCDKECRRGPCQPTTTTAPAPSAKSELATIFSAFQPYWWCRLHISTAQSKHAGRRVGGDERLRHPQAVERSMAAHESHLGASDAGGKPQLLDQGDVEARRVEPAARDGHQVRDLFRSDPRIDQSVPRGRDGQGAGLFFILTHPVARGGAGVAVKRLPRASVAIRRLQHHAVPRLDARSPVNGVEDTLVIRRLARVLPGELGGLGLGDPVRWDGGADPGDQHGHGQLAFVKDGGAFKRRKTNPADAGGSAQDLEPDRSQPGLPQHHRDRATDELPAADQSPMKAPTRPGRSAGPIVPWPARPGARRPGPTPGPRRSPRR